MTTHARDKAALLAAIDALSDALILPARARAKGTATPPLAIYTRYCPATLIVGEKKTVSLRYAPLATRAIPETARTDK